MDYGIILIVALITILALILFIVTLLSYRKYKNRKLLLVSMVFFFLLIRGVLLSLGLFYASFTQLTTSGYIWLFDLAVLIFLYAAYSLKR